jgi:hypothetical protein
LKKQREQKIVTELSSGTRKKKKKQKRKKKAEEEQRQVRLDASVVLQEA